MWNNLAQKFFIQMLELLCLVKTEFRMVRDRAWGIYGELKAVTSNRERTLRLSRSDLLISASVEAFSVCCIGISLGLQSRQISAFANNVLLFVAF